MFVRARVLLCCLVSLLTVLSGLALQAAQAVPSAPEGCTISATLVNSCRPWLGTTANRYPEENVPPNPAALSDKHNQMLWAEERMGRPMEVAHTYRTVNDKDPAKTQHELLPEDVSFATRKDTILFVDYAITKDWSTADGSDPGITAGIDKMAASVKALGDTKILMSLAHEPENDVETTAGCTGLDYGSGNFGTPEEYRALWRFVHERFDAAGVTNVVWVMNYMNYDPFNCMVDELYPGDDYVDWIVWNAYQHGDEDVSFVREASNLYYYLKENSTPEHDYLSKAWGLAEWGINLSTQENAYRYYEQAKAAVEADALPRLKLYANFDNGDEAKKDYSYRVAYGVDPTPNDDVDDAPHDPAEQAAFNAFASSWRFVGDGTPLDEPPVAPKGLTATVTGTGGVSLSWSAATGDLGVVSYDVYRDGARVANTTDLSWTDASTPQGATYTYTVRAVDTVGQTSGHSEAATAVVPDTTAPSQPSDLTVVLRRGAPRLTWSAATDNLGVASYDVVRDGVTVDTTTGLTYVDLTAAQGATYAYTVHALDAAGNIGPSSASQQLTVPDSTAPTAPGSLRLTRERTRATLRWKPASDNVGVARYVVFQGKKVVSRVDAGSRTVTVTRLRARTAYTFRVVARDRAGNVGPAASARG